MINSTPPKAPIAFEYFEVRPCIARGGHIDSYGNEEEYLAALANYESDYQRLGRVFKTFWTIYGRYDHVKPHKEMLALAIGDFTKKEDAHEVMNAILAPMAAARDLIRDKGETVLEVQNGIQIKAYMRAASDLDDFINQCSNMERI